MFKAWQELSAWSQELWLNECLKDFKRQGVVELISKLCYAVDMESRATCAHRRVLPLFLARQGLAQIRLDRNSNVVLQLRFCYFFGAPNNSPSNVRVPMFCLWMAGDPENVWYLERENPDADVMRKLLVHFFSWFLRCNTEQL